MRRAIVGLMGMTILVSCTVSCGAPNPPLPPSLRLPAPVSDLRAVRKGEHVYLGWTAPVRTTDHQTIRGSTTVEICRGVLPMAECGVPVGTVTMAAPVVVDKKAA